MIAFKSFEAFNQKEKQGIYSQISLIRFLTANMKIQLTYQFRNKKNRKLLLICLLGYSMSSSLASRVNLALMVDSKSLTPWSVLVKARGSMFTQNWVQGTVLSYETVSISLLNRLDKNGYYKI